MYALLFLALTALLAVIAELALLALFLKGATTVHFTPPMAPSFLHVSRVSRMKLLAALHLLFTVAVLCIAYLALW